MLSPEKQVIRKAASEKLIEMKPAVIPYFVELTLPSLHDPLGDFDRLKKSLLERYHLYSIEIDYSVLLKLSQVLRQGEGKVTAVVWMDKEILDVRPGRADDLYGLAIDVGTTTVAGYLCNLRTGEVISTQSMMNPQIPYGEDVMSRITYTMAHQEGLEKIHRSIIDGLNQLIKTMMGDCHLQPEDIFELSIVGNTVMHHLLLRLDPQYLGHHTFHSYHPSVNGCKGKGFGFNSLSVSQCPPVANRSRLCGSG